MCLHRKKYHDIKNKMYEECHGYYLAEYDIYCTKCGKVLGHWAYGSAEPEFIIKYQLKGIKKIITWFGYYILKNICRECQNKKQAQIYRDSKKVKELEKENQELKADYGTKAQVERDLLMEENQELKQDIKNLVNVINKNCVELSTTDAEYESLRRWNK